MKLRQTLVVYSLVKVLRVPQDRNDHGKGVETVKDPQVRPAHEFVGGSTEDTRGKGGVTKR